MESEPQNAREPRTCLPPGQVDCKWWKRGHCFRGNQCYFRHDDALAGVDRLLPKRAAAGATAAHNRTDASVADNPLKAETSEEQCGICMETPTIFGLLVNCDHVFCLDCIRSWRSSVGTSAEDMLNSADSRVSRKTTKTCPLCRIKSEYVVPSSVFPTPPHPTTFATDTTLGETVNTDDPAGNAEPSTLTGAGNPAKAEIIDRYLARLKAIPCRYFEESIQRWRELPIIENPDSVAGGLLHPAFSGECLFGNECHFAHNHPITKAPYIFTRNEISLMKRANHERRARALRRAVYGQDRRRLGVREDPTGLNGMLETISIEEDYESSATSDLPFSLEGDSVDFMIDDGMVVVEMLVGRLGFAESYDNGIFDFF
ncbi:hypothetical protein AJ78_01078 [Emergomyces pasteurianus Ep9510]|uniref:Uncharacterized protein n=1 Tax=Emergomyces pasteurianus Ep9510 TaxID=1447872 RepID=A0A1J9PRW7_9EURO|nr:hypothetical protein AJ78_01078 [Emergomyces pasteurianus Ep9510]